MLVCLMLLWWLVLYWWRSWREAATQSRRFARRTTKQPAEQPPVHAARRKPEWVIQEVLRLKALMWTTGCRKIADNFNDQHAALTGCTVGKTFVSLSCLRKEMRNRLPRPVPINAIWAMDLTFYTDASGKQQMALGIIDHGSRLLTCLQTMVNKRSWTLLGYLCLAIGRHGKPSRIRQQTPPKSAVLATALDGLLVGYCTRR